MIGSKKYVKEPISLDALIGNDKDNISVNIFNLSHVTTPNNL